MAGQRPLGIELGRLIYWNRTRETNIEHFVKADRDKLAIHTAILGLFFVGGVIGAAKRAEIPMVAGILANRR